jgi:hypothetical protein
MVYPEAITPEFIESVKSRRWRRILNSFFRVCCIGNPIRLVSETTSPYSGYPGRLPWLDGYSYRDLVRRFNDCEGDVYEQVKHQGWIAPNADVTVMHISYDERPTGWHCLDCGRHLHTGYQPKRCFTCKGLLEPSSAEAVGEYIKQKRMAELYFIDGVYHCPECDAEIDLDTWESGCCSARCNDCSPCHDCVMGAM